MRAWTTVATAPSKEGPLELRQRGETDFLILVGGRVLMSSAARRSEEALGSLGCAPIAARPRPRVLIGGLGMGFTLRAALDALPRDARITVVELSRAIVDWCRGPLSALTAHALTDRRVELALGDVARTIAARPRATLDAILLDLYEGPFEATQRRDHPIYGPTALAATRAALAPGGVLAIWSEDIDPRFPERLAAADFSVETHRVGRGGRKHAVYLGRAVEAPSVRPKTSGNAPARGRR